MELIAKGMGWIPDRPDCRDFTPETPLVVDQLKNVHGLHLSKRSKKTEKPLKMPVSIDLSSYCSPIEDQKSLGACTAHAAIGLLEYFEQRAYGKYIDGSRLFLYKVSRKLLMWTGDTGAYLRTAMQALAAFGTPPEKYYPYVISKFEEEPSAFCYSFAQSYKGLKYYRLDSGNTTPTAAIASMKKEYGRWIAQHVRIYLLPKRFGSINHKWWCNSLSKKYRYRGRWSCSDCNWI